MSNVETLSVKEAYKKHSRIARMRMGQDAPELVTLPSAPEVQFALVPLTESEHNMAIMYAASIDAPDNVLGIEMRDRAEQIHSLWQALREPNDLEKRVFDSVDEMANLLERIDLNNLGDYYLRMIDESSPSLDGLSDEDLETLKKALLSLDMSVLFGKPWWHLKGFFSTLSPTQLRVKLPGSLSTPTSTMTNDEKKSTLGASQS